MPTKKAKPKKKITTAKKTTTKKSAPKKKAEVVVEKEEKITASQEVPTEKPEVETTAEDKEKPEVETIAEPKVKVAIPPTITVRDFADRLKMTVPEVITALMNNGIMASINEEVDYDTAALLAEELGFKAEKEINEEDITKEKGVRKQLQEEFAEADESDLKNRPPVVAVMGHVDHGKTKLLDAIRETNIIDTEAGGITQKIGAYQVKEKGRQITFIDTPGHEAFAAMRERGAKVTDIAILVVAADDGVKPQTKEAIKHIKKAGVPMIVAINKIDKPEADPERVKKELADNQVMPEEWGGDTVCVAVSAKQKTNINELLDMILLVAEMENLKANPKASAIGTVIESDKNPKRGVEATILVQNGTLKQSDVITVGSVYGKIKAMENCLGKRINHAKPATPVRILGLESVPEVGDILFAEESIDKARQKVARLKKFSHPVALKAESKDKKGKIKKLNIILKADTQGSLEAVMESLVKIKSDEVQPAVISYGVGKITESDIMMATSSLALVVSFNTSVTSVAQRMAEDGNIEIKSYDVIYNLIDEIKKRLEDMLEPEVIRTDLGKLEILAVFRTEPGKMIVGGKVLSKHLENNTLVQVLRGKKDEQEEMGTGKITSLQTNKVEVKKVKQGEEAGIMFEGDVRIKVGDILETWREEVKKKIL
ncbi:translation initiation factor IF-2 [Patescibacteria group bacterium]|nr:translation initiation factor IF-2 [Patescibacteria group bacterium]